MSPLDEFAAHPTWVAYILVAFTVVIVANLIAADIHAANSRRSRRAGSPSGHGTNAGTVEPSTHHREQQA